MNVLRKPSLGSLLVRLAVETSWSLRQASGESSTRPSLSVRHWRPARGTPKPPAGPPGASLFSAAAGDYWPGAAVPLPAPAPPTPWEGGAVAPWVEPTVGTELGDTVGDGPVLGVAEDVAPPLSRTLPGALPLWVGVGVEDGVVVALLFPPPRVVPVPGWFHPLEPIGLPVPSSISVITTSDAMNTMAAVITGTSQRGRSCRKRAPQLDLPCRPPPD